MRGFVPTPERVVDHMVNLLFAGDSPSLHLRVLDPGAGHGAFVAGIARYCVARGAPLPEIVAVEQDPARLSGLRRAAADAVQVEAGDVLEPNPPWGAAGFDRVIGNPPYVSILSLTEREKEDYRRRFTTASGRFDLYLLFFERALDLLKAGGRLVFITPEKFTYVETAAPLRRMLASCHVELLEFVDEETFPGVVAYPLITVVRKAEPGLTRVRHRDGGSLAVRIPSDGGSWRSLLSGGAGKVEGPTLADLCLRISAGVATGADGLFVVPTEQLPAEWRPFARPTVSGRQLRDDFEPTHSMVVPYDAHSTLLPLDRLGAFGGWLAQPANRARLAARTCATRKPWYAFHETPPMEHLLRPKLLWKDIAERPDFWEDGSGALVPRHSVYYLVPREGVATGALLEYLRSATAARWMADHCQRAAKGYLRLQSRVLRDLPIPGDLVPAAGLQQGVLALG